MIENLVNDFMLLILFLVVSGVIVKLASSSKPIDGGLYTKSNWGSSLNFTNIIRGLRWSTPSQIKNFSKKQKSDPVFIDDFAMFSETKQKLRKSKTPTISVHVDRLSFTKTVVALGGMGSGKTQFFFSILLQNAFNRAILHDFKGDFVAYLYDSRKDFILNLFDRRHANWSIFEELKDNAQVAIAFISALVFSASGKDAKVDVWVSSASDLIKQWLFDAHFEATDASDVQKWQSFFSKKAAYEAASQNDKTKASVLLSAKLCLEIFELIAHHANKPAFTIKQFLNKQDTKLFLLNNQAYSAALDPYFSAFVTAFVSVQLGRPDTKTDLTLYLLDEYYSFHLKDETERALLTAIRSKGGCCMLGMQYQRLDDRSKQQLLDSSRFALVCFNLNDGATIDHLCQNIFGSVEFQSKKVSKNGKQTTVTTENHKQLFITPSQLQTMPPYHHLTYIPSEKIMYLGYTPAPQLFKAHPEFAPIDQNDFYLKKFDKGGEK